MVFALVLDDTLAAGYALNAAAHMAAQFGTFASEIRGTVITDQSSVQHLGLPIYGNVILGCAPDDLRARLQKARNAAKDKDAESNCRLIVVDYPEEGFTTATDEDLVREVSAKQESEIRYRGFLIYGPKKTVRKITEGLRLWK